MHFGIDFDTGPSGSDKAVAQDYGRRAASEERRAGKDRRVPTAQVQDVWSPPEETISVLIASDRSWTRETLLPALLAAPGFALVDASPADIGQLGVAAAKYRPHLAVVDTALLAHGTMPLHEVGALIFPSSLVLIVSELDSHLAESILQERVSGVLSVGADGQSCISALRKICGGEIWLPRWLLCRALLHVRARPQGGQRQEADQIQPAAPLTRREFQVARMVADGLSNKEIAVRAKVSIDTVKKHLQSVYTKFGIHRRAQVLHRLPTSDRDS